MLIELLNFHFEIPSGRLQNSPKIDGHQSIFKNEKFQGNGDFCLAKTKIGCGTVLVSGGSSPLSYSSVRIFPFGPSFQRVHFRFLVASPHQLSTGPKLNQSGGGWRYKLRTEVSPLDWAIQLFSSFLLHFLILRVVISARFLHIFFRLLCRRPIVVHLRPFQLQVNSPICMSI